VHSRRVLIFSFAFGDQDEEEQEDEQTTDGDTHSNQPSLVGRKLVVVFRAGHISDTDHDTVRVSVDGLSSGSSDLENDVIFNSLGEVEFTALPDTDGESERSLLHDWVSIHEVHNVSLLEARGGPASSIVGRFKTSGVDGCRGRELGNDGDLIAERRSSSGRSSCRSNSWKWLREASCGSSSLSSR